MAVNWWNFIWEYYNTIPSPKEWTKNSSRYFYTWNILMFKNVNMYNI